MKDNLPEAYVPASLREPKPKVRETAYACGYKNGTNSCGMFAGPFQALIEALDVVPDESGVERTAFLFRFNEDGTEDTLYLWHPAMGAWKRWRPR